MDNFVILSVSVILSVAVAERSGSGAKPSFGWSAESGDLVFCELFTGFPP